MDGSTVQKHDGYTLHNDVTIGTAPLKGEETTLRAALYLPDNCVEPPPLLIWLHGGAFKFGSYKQRICGRVGRRMVRAGIAVAAIQYRLHAEPGDLSPLLQDQLADLPSKGRQLIRKGLTHHRSLAAMEDTVAFLHWAGGAGEHYRWSDKQVVGGVSAGGITALNVLFTAPALGLVRPTVVGAFSASGGHNFPDMVHGQAQAKVLALHNPLDDRVSIKGVRMLKEKLGDAMELLESDSMIHGHINLTDDERPMTSFNRISGFVHRCAG